MPRKKKDNTPIVAPGFRPPGDRTPIRTGPPPEKKKPVLRKPGGGIAMMEREAARQKYEAEKKAAAERLAAAGIKIPSAPPKERFVYVPDYKAAPGHELYLTEDFKGRLRTHTVYKAPPSKVPVVPGLGKRKVPPKNEVSEK